MQHHELGPVALGLLKRQIPDGAGVVARAASDDAAADGAGVRPGRAAGHGRDRAAAAPLTLDLATLVAVHLAVLSCNATIGRVTRRSRTLLILVVALGVLAVGAVWIVVRAQQAADALASARTGVDCSCVTTSPRGAPPRPRSELAVVQGDTARAVKATSDPVFDVASAIPVLGTTPAAVRDVAEAADALALEALPDLLEAGTALSADALRADGRPAEPRGVRDRVPGARLRRGSRSARSTADVAGIDTSRHSGAGRGRRHSLQGRARRRAGRDAVGGAGAALIPPMLGADGERSYLLALQSNNEARGTGGFFGSFGIFSADDGKIRVDKLAAAIDPRRPEYDEMPLDFGPDYAALYGDDAASWAGANYLAALSVRSEAVVEDVEGPHG